MAHTTHTLYGLACDNGGCSRNITDITARAYVDESEAAVDATNYDWTTNGQTGTDERWHCNECEPWCWNACGAMAGPEPDGRQYYCPACWEKRCRTCETIGQAKVDGQWQICPDCHGSGMHLAGGGQTS